MLAGVASQSSAAVADYLNAQIDHIVAGSVGLRNGEDPIHDTRVAIRRLRSTVRVFAKVLDGTGDLDDDLKWFAGLLGEVRDCQVQRRRFTAAIDDLPRELVLGPVKSRIRNDLRAVELPARRRVSEEMESDRYQALMAVLQEWRIRPPVVRGCRAKRCASRLPGPPARPIGGWPQRLTTVSQPCCIGPARPRSALATPPN